MYWIGEYLYNREQYDKAEALFTKLFTEFPEHELADDSLYWAGGAAARQKRFPRASELYNRLLTENKKSNKLVDCYYALGETLIELFKNSDAIVAFDEIINKYPEHELAPRAMLRKGLCHYQLGVKDAMEYEKAVQSYTRVINTPGTPGAFRYNAEFNIGQCLEKQGKRDGAFEQFYRIVTRYDQERREGERHSLEIDNWFEKAANEAVRMMIADDKWVEAHGILRRVAEAGVAGSKDAARRADEIRRDKWPLF